MADAEILSERDTLVPLTLLGTAGVPDQRVPEGPSDPCLVEGLRWMIFSRLLDAKCMSKQRQGQLGTYPPAIGQEAAIIGTSTALDPIRDWVVPQYREGAALVRHGLPLELLLRYFRGDPRSGAIPLDVNTFPPQIALAAQLPHAVGIAWGLQLAGSDGVVAAFVGDGASSEGDFHEALNLAGVRNAPVVFLLQNNGWAISTPRARQSAARTLASRAAGYGMAGHYIDGNDFLAVHATVAAAVRRARGGGGPSLIEAVTNRLGPHNTADDPTRYRGEAGANAHADPIQRLTAHLRARGLVESSDLVRFKADASEQIARAFTAADAIAPIDPSDLFRHVAAVSTLRSAPERPAVDASRGP